MVFSLVKDFVDIFAKFVILVVENKELKRLEELEVIRHDHHYALDKAKKKLQGFESSEIRDGIGDDAS